MSNLADALILYRVWATHFDPHAPDLNRCAYAVQESWRLVAAAARMLSEMPEPAPAIVPGLPYMATFPPRETWAGDAPRRPAIGFTLEGSPFTHVVDARPGELPIFASTSAPPTFRRIPGFIYDPEDFLP